MKRYLGILCAAACLFVFFACARKKNTPDTTTPAQTTPAVTSTTQEITTRKVLDTTEQEKGAGTRKYPFHSGETAFFDGMKTLFDTYRIELTLLEVVRGDEAWQMAKDGSQRNKPAKEGMEYLFARFKVKALESKDDRKIDINPDNFDLVSETGIKYNDFVVVSGLEPNLAEMYAGAEQEGYVYFLVDKNDENPLIVFLERNEGGVWFIGREDRP